MPSHRAFFVVMIAFACAVTGVLGVAGLRLSDRPADLISQRDPDGMLLGFEVGADRVGPAAFSTDIAVTGAGEVIFAEHLTGRIAALVPDAAGGFQERTVLEVELPDEGRLFHVALHPGWPGEPYLYFTAHEGVGRQQRLAVFRARVEGLEAVEVERMVGGLPTEDPARGPQADHYGSALAACGDWLYLSVGDTDSPGPGYYRQGGIRFRAQRLEYAEGKVLRYRFDGGDLAPAGELSETPPVFAMGLRNVFSMDCDPETGQLWAGDNGPAGHDQVRMVAAGTDHGWPASVERREPTAPVFATGGAAVAPTGIVVREHAGGREVLFSAFHTEAIYRLRIDADGVMQGPVELAHRAPGAVLAMGAAADGCIYFSTADAIWRLRETSCGEASSAGSGGDVDAGRFAVAAAATYQSNCAGCHGLEREGGIGPRLQNDRLTRSDEFYIDTILKGRPERGMPAWGDAGMTEDQARRLLEYLRSTR